MEEQAERFRYRWMTLGDLNGFFSVLFDNMTVLAFLAFVLTVTFRMPNSVVYGRIFPGLALGLFIGDLAYVALAFIQAKRQNKDVTAMPLTIDTPTALGLALALIGPIYIEKLNKGLDMETAALQTWYVGMAATLYCGILKFIFSFISEWIAKNIPQAGLLGSLAGMGIALLTFIPMLQVAGAPTVGLVAMGLIFYSVFAKTKLPFNLPGIFVAVLVGTVIYYALAPRGFAGYEYQPSSFQMVIFYPQLAWGFVDGLKDALNYLPIIIPFAVLASVAGVNLTSSAKVAGDDYNVKEILWIDAMATIVASLFGGITQTTTYVGQGVCQNMGCKAGYTLLAGLTVGFFAVLGLIQSIVDFVPTAALAPILCFVGLQMLFQAYANTEKKYFPAISFALLPVIIRVLATEGAYYQYGFFEGLIAYLSKNPTRFLAESLLIPALSNGFILTSTLWGAFLVLMIDRRLKECSLCMLVLSVLSYFGLVHSVYPSGAMYLPWQLPNSVMQAVPYQFSLGYLFLGMLIYLLSYTKESQESIYTEE